MKRQHIYGERVVFARVRSTLFEENLEKVLHLREMCSWLRTRERTWTAAQNSNTAIHDLLCDIAFYLFFLVWDLNCTHLFLLKCVETLLSGTLPNMFVQDIDCFKHFMAMSSSTKALLSKSMNALFIAQLKCVHLLCHIFAFCSLLTLYLPGYSTVE